MFYALGTMSDKLKSRGSVELCALLEAMGGTRSEQAERFGVSKVTLLRWMSGDTPAAAMRLRIRTLGGPLPEAWDEILPTAPSEPPPRGELPALVPATAEATRDLATRLHRLAEQEIRSLEEGGGEEPPAKRLGRIASAADIVVQLGKLTGAAGIDERRIVASPAWARLWDRMCNALEPWPDAMRACADALLGATP